MCSLLSSARLALGVLASLLAAAAGALAAEPVVNGVLPSIGTPNTARTVTIKGEGFAAGASVRLSYGGMMEVATVPVSGWDSAIVEGMAYVISDVLAVYDVHEPGSPAFVGSCDIPGIGRRIAVSGGVAYVGDTVGNVHIVDISSPEDPKVISSFRSGANFSVQDVAYSQGYLYANIAWKISVIDVREPSTPTLVNTVTTPGNNLEGILVKGSVLYACGYQVVLFDITSPEQPTELSRLPAGGFPDRPGSLGGGRLYRDGPQFLGRGRAQPPCPRAARRSRPGVRILRRGDRPRESLHQECARRTRGLRCQEPQVTRV